MRHFVAAAVFTSACILYFLVASVAALDCYTCSYRFEDGLDTCISQPQHITKNCTKKYCTIMRQEKRKPKGVVNSFLRDCVDSPPFLNKVITDETFKTYYRSCTTDNCNDGDGIDGSGESYGAASNTVIDGKSAASKLRSLTFYSSCGLLGSLLLTMLILRS